MIEVFRTNVERPMDASWLLGLLYQHFPGSRIHFDLEDGDRILRLEGKDIQVEKVLDLVRESGFSCAVLD